MIAFSSARTNRALAIAMKAVVEKIPKQKPAKGRPRKGTIRAAEIREIGGLKAILSTSPLFAAAEFNDLCDRIDTEMQKPR